MRGVRGAGGAVGAVGAQGVDMKIFIRSEAQETSAAVLETIAS